MVLQLYHHMYIIGLLKLLLCLEEAGIDLILSILCYRTSHIPSLSNIQNWMLICFMVKPPI